MNHYQITETDLIQLETMTLSHSYMFRRVMENQKIAQRVAKLFLKDIQNTKQESSTTEKTIKLHPQSKEIRMDYFYADDYSKLDLEMQNYVDPFFEERAGCYASFLATEAFESGKNYQEIQETYVVFLCTFDPFHKGQPIYCFRRHDRELNYQLNDKSHIYIYNLTKAEEIEDKSIRNLGLYIMHSITNDTLTKEIDKMVKRIRNDKASYFAELREKLERRSYEAWLKQEGHKEGLAEGLEKGRTEGLEKGRTEGLEKGRTEGLEKGRTEGLEEGELLGLEKCMNAIAINMKKSGVSNEFISQMTGLSLEAIACL